MIWQKNMQNNSNDEDNLVTENLNLVDKNFDAVIVTSRLN